MPTAQSLINTAFKELRVYAPDLDSDALESADGLSRLNGMMANKAADIGGLGVAALVTATATGNFPLTVGTHGDIDTARPASVAAVTWGAISARTWPLEMVSWAKIQELRLRRFSDPNTPVVACYRPEYPRGQLFLWPEPSSGTITIQGLVPRYQWATLSTNIDLPPGLQIAIEYGLAAAIAGQFQLAAGDELLGKAQTAWAAFAATAEAIE